MIYATVHAFIMLFNTMEGRTTYQNIVIIVGAISVAMTYFAIMAE